MSSGVNSMSICCICDCASSDLRLLDCLHNCCSECIRKTKHEEIIKCLKCNVETLESSCYTNDFLKMSLDRNTDSIEPKQCSVCQALGKYSEADIQCCNCRQAFCRQCSTYHDVFHPYHVMIAIENLFESAAAAASWLCQKHGLPLQYVYKECDKILCTMCKSSTDADRGIESLKIEDVPAIVARTRGRVERAISELECANLTPDRAVKCKADIAAMRKDCYKKVLQNKRKLLDYIEIEYQKVIQVMDQFSDQMEEELFRKQEEEERLEKCSQVALTYARHLIVSQMDKTVIDQHERVLKRLQGLLKERQENNLTTTDAPELRISGDSIDEEQCITFIRGVLGTPLMNTGSGSSACTLSAPHPQDKEELGDTASTEYTGELQDDSKSTKQNELLPEEDYYKVLEEDHTDNIVDKRDTDEDPYVSENIKDNEDASVDNLEADIITKEREDFNRSLSADQHFSQECYAAQSQIVVNMTRKDAEACLLLPNRSVGTYLIRKSESHPGCLSLSIRCETEDGSPCAKHYVIFKTADEMMYLYLSEQFTTLEELIDYYKTSSDGLCATLSVLCFPKDQDETQVDEDIRQMARKSVRLVKKLSEGEFGQIWKGILLNLTEVAVKTAKSNAAAKDALLEEANMMKKCVHDNIVKLYAVCSKGGQLCIVMELIPNGSLQQYLRQSPKRQDIVEIVEMATQIANGMSYLEDIRVVHGDLAARNVLVANNNHMKIADFGLAKTLEEKKDSYVIKKGNKLPIKWSAPEVIASGSISNKSDVWSFGITLMEIVTSGQAPYPGMSAKEVITETSKGYRMPCPDECENDLYEIILRCWYLNPKRRPSFKTLHEVFTAYFNVYTEI